MVNDKQLLEDLFKAYFDARKNKRNTNNQLRFELNFESKLFELYKEISSKQYQISPSICFIVDKPVKREIFAADFRDRVIHHLIFNYINPYFDSLFIDDSYSCRKGKGTLYGVKRIANFIKECSNNYTTDCYILKLDIEGYFMNINKEILGIVVKKYLDNDVNANITYNKDLLFYLLDCVLGNDPTVNCRMRGSKTDWSGLPFSKSLFSRGRHQGLAIGNLTSQLFSNIYLHDFDCYIKKQLGIQYYGRYVDDFVIVHYDMKFLRGLIPVLSEYLQENCGLKIHPKKIYLQHYTRGVAYLGAIIKPHRLYVTNRTKQNFRKVMRGWESYLSSNTQPSSETKMNMLNTINSYLGIMSHYRTFNIRKEELLVCPIPNIFKHAYIKHISHKSMYFSLYKKSNQYNQVCNDKNNNL